MGWFKRRKQGVVTPTKEKKETPRGKSRKYSSNDAKRNRPGAGFEPLSGQRAGVS